MKIVYVLLIALIVPIKSFGFTCEAEINKALSIWSMEVQPHDFDTSPPSQTKTYKDPPPYFNLIPKERKITYAGINTPKSGITIKSDIKVKNPDDTQKAPYTNFISDVKIKLGANCKLQSFVVTTYQPKGRTLLPTQITVSSGTCAKIYTHSNLKDETLLKELGVPDSEKEAYKARVIPNCRRRPSGSDDAKRFAPGMVRLIYSDEELKTPYQKLPSVAPASAISTGGANS